MAEPRRASEARETVRKAFDEASAYIVGKKFDYVLGVTSGLRVGLGQLLGRGDLTEREAFLDEFNAKQDELLDRLFPETKL